MGRRTQGATRSRWTGWGAIAQVAVLAIMGLGAAPGTALALGDEVTAIAAGEYHTCGRTSLGTVWCWGYGADGQLGNGTTDDAATPIKVRPGGHTLGGIVAVAGGTGHTCALKQDGTVRCWGEADHGQLGDGTTGDPVDHVRLTAVRVTRPGGPLAKVRALDTGISHTCAVRTDRTVWCWGRNANGELGRGSKDGDPHPFPTRVLFP